MNNSSTHYEHWWWRGLSITRWSRSA